jgi:hypothetical protein
MDTIRVSRPERDFVFVDKDSLDPREQLRDWKGLWIPKEVWLSDLGFLEKCLLVEIDSLSKNNSGCYASNEYFARFMGVSEDYIRKVLTSLRKLGLVKTKSFDGRYRYLAVDFSKIRRRKKKPAPRHKSATPAPAQKCVG